MKRSAGALLAAALVAGCGSDSETTPTACLGGAGGFLAALETAPVEVAVGGDVAIDECLVKDQSAGQLNTVGEGLIAAATELNAGARKDPRGVEATGLGYLVGAVEAGASATAGIHADLVLRINAAARFNEGGEPLPAAFERTFGAAYAAARKAG